MAWSNLQKAQVVRACRAQGIEDQRELILRQLGGRAEHPAESGKITSTSPRLTQRDFERTMAVIEAYSGGQIRTKVKGKHLYAPGHWARSFDYGIWKRRRFLAGRLTDELATRTSAGYVVGVINRALSLPPEQQIHDDRDVDLDNFDEREMAKVIDALQKLDQRTNEPQTGKDPTPDAPMATPTR